MSPTRAIAEMIIVITHVALRLFERTRATINTVVVTRDLKKKAFPATSSLPFC